MPWVDYKETQPPLAAVCVCSSRSTGEMACDCGGTTRQPKLFMLSDIQTCPAGKDDTLQLDVLESLSSFIIPSPPFMYNIPRTLCVVYGPSS